MWSHLPFLTLRLRNVALLRENSDPAEESDIDVNRPGPKTSFWFPLLLTFRGFDHNLLAHAGMVF